jgi:hypothetical protein
VIDLTSDDLADGVRRITAGKGVDIAIVSVGGTGSSARRSSRCAQVASRPKRMRPLPIRTCSPEFGLTEGVQKMKVGEKARLVCPSDTAYGDYGRGSSGSASTRRGLWGVTAGALCYGATRRHRMRELVRDPDSNACTANVCQPSACSTAILSFNTDCCAFVGSEETA